MSRWRLTQCLCASVLAVPVAGNTQTARPEWTLETAYEFALRDIINTVNARALGYRFPAHHERLELEYGFSAGGPEWAIAIDLNEPGGWIAEIVRLDGRAIGGYAEAIYSAPETPLEELRASLPLKYAVANGRICPRADELIQNFSEQSWSLVDSYPERYTETNGAYLPAPDGDYVDVSIKRFDVSTSINGPSHPQYVTGWAVQLSQELEACERPAPRPD